MQVEYAELCKSLDRIAEAIIYFADLLVMKERNKLKEDS
jgi:hypothetical protein